MERHLATAGAIGVDDGEHALVFVVARCEQQHKGCNDHQEFIGFHNSSVLIVCKYQVVPVGVPGSTSGFPGVYLQCNTLVVAQAVIVLLWGYMPSRPWELAASEAR